MKRGSSQGLRTAIQVDGTADQVDVVLPRNFWLYVRFRRRFRRAIALSAAWSYRVRGARPVREVAIWIHDEEVFALAEQQRARETLADAEWQAASAADAPPRLTAAAG